MRFLLIVIFIVSLNLMFGLFPNNESNYAYSQSVYVDENDLEKPAPKILSFKQVNDDSIKVVWELDKHPDGLELKFFNVEITIGLNVDCCGPETNIETFEEANSEPISSEVREFLISSHKGQPLKDKTEYCVEIEAQWPGPNLDSQPECLIFDKNFKTIPSKYNYNLMLFVVGIAVAAVIAGIIIKIRSRFCV